jgi:hypothetical protein
MSPSPRRPSHTTLYRSAGTYRRRRLLAATGVGSVLVVLFVAVGVWAWARGGDASPAHALAEASATAKAKATPPPSSAATPPPSPTPSATRTVITIGWVGDTTPGSRYGNPPDGGRALFAQVRDELRAPDLMLANLEGTYSDGGASKCDGSDSSACFAFQAPPSFAKALPWAGIDLVNMANNHANDYFQGGIDQTTAALKKNDVEYTGLPDQITTIDVKGVKVAVIGFSPYPWNANINDIPAAKELVKRASAEADVVVVVMHVGAEGSDKTHTPHGTEYAFGENRGDPRAFAHAVVDSGADLVVGSGPHVIRGIERYRTRLIAYSLGNFAGWGNFGISGTLALSGLLTVKIDNGGHIHGGRWLSLRLTDPGVPVVDPSDSSAHLVDQLSAADFSNTFKMSADGQISVK